MPDVIRNGAVTPDAWTFVGLGEGFDAAAPLPTGAIVVPLAAWQAQREALLARNESIGVWLAPADDAEALRGDLGRLALIAVQFPKFTDGRGYSTAVLLRRAGYQGELRAFGDLGRDQLFYLSRVGFDAFALREREDLAGAIASLRDFHETYQGSINQPAPLFRRRETAGTTR
ncbi:oxidoreductase [Betaproteobacteria bacterium GR16-43]|nr:oxidoreductase [Betaproteobacteria bacterium GR16-43]